MRLSIPQKMRPRHCHLFLHKKCCLVIRYLGMRLKLPPLPAKMDATTYTPMPLMGLQRTRLLLHAGLEQLSLSLAMVLMSTKSQKI